MGEIGNPVREEPLVVPPPNTTPAPAEPSPEVKPPIKQPEPV